MSMGDELEKLRALHERGALSDAEYAAAKARVLDAAPAGSAAAGGGVPDDFLHRLHRSRSDRWLGGVCGGLARQIGLPSWFVRLAFVLAACTFGAGILLYIVSWIFIPEEPVAG